MTASPLVHQAAAWIRDRVMTSNLNPRCVALFGSVVRSSWKPESDFDLLLIGDRIPRRPFERGDLFGPISTEWRAHPLFKSLPRALSPLYLSEQGWLDSSGLRLSLSSEA